MKRLPVHGLFALAAVAAAVGVAVTALRLQQTQRLNTAIAAAAQAPASAPVPRDAPREVRLAHATALSQAGAYDAAFRGFSGLIDAGQVDAVGRHALYNLGTMYLRQGLGPAAAAGGDSGAAAPATDVRTGPLVELAKQRLRDALRADPNDWDARYNLERALRAAPEEQDTTVEETNTPVERRNVMLRGLVPGDLP